MRPLRLSHLRHIDRLYGTLPDPVQAVFSGTSAGMLANHGMGKHMVRMGEFTSQMPDHRGEPILPMKVSNRLMQGGAWAVEV